MVIVIVKNQLLWLLLLFRINCYCRYQNNCQYQYQLMYHLERSLESTVMVIVIVQNQLFWLLLLFIINCFGYGQCTPCLPGESIKGPDYKGSPESE